MTVSPAKWYTGRVQYTSGRMSLPISGSCPVRGLFLVASSRAVSTVPVCKLSGFLCVTCEQSLGAVCVPSMARIPSSSGRCGSTKQRTFREHCLFSTLLSCTCNSSVRKARDNLRCNVPVYGSLVSNVGVAEIRLLEVLGADSLQALPNIGLHQQPNRLVTRTLVCSAETVFGEMRWHIREWKQGTEYSSR